jgi:hypothetical protein
MKFIKQHRTVTQWYTVEDGPIMDSDPRRLSARRFKVERVSVSWMDGEVQRVFVHGQAVLADGSMGKLYHDRTLLGGTDLPEWLHEVLDIEE